MCVQLISLCDFFSNQETSTYVRMYVVELYLHLHGMVWPWYVCTYMLQETRYIIIIIECLCMYVIVRIQKALYGNSIMLISQESLGNWTKTNIIS